jgi:phage antirepressor YoqD-like protein
MEDENILKQMGLSDGELREFLRKINVFFNHTLNDEERRAFLRGLKSVEDAARELKNVTPERLEKFIREHEPTIVPFNTCKKY